MRGAHLDIICEMNSEMQSKIGDEDIYLSIYQTLPVVTVPLLENCFRTIDLKSSLVERLIRRWNNYRNLSIRKIIDLQIPFWIDSVAKRCINKSGHGEN